MNQQRSHNLLRPSRILHAALLITATGFAVPSNASAQSDDSPPLESLHFTSESRPAPVEQAPIDDPATKSVLDFDTKSESRNEKRSPGIEQSPLEVLTELMLIRARDAEHPQPDTTETESVDFFSLRFEDASSANSLWSRNDTSAGLGRLEVLPALYLRSGQVLDEGYESADYADLYAELGVDLTSNTGLWLRYERLRQALGESREGEQRDADALYLQFELRF